MTRWLSADEQVAWRHFLRATSLLTQRLDDGLERRDGLTGTDYEILVILSETPDHRLRMSDLADQVLVSRSRLTYRIELRPGGEDPREALRHTADLSAADIAELDRRPPE